jgi:hypothetical protein
MSNPCPLQHQCRSHEDEYTCKHVDDICGPARWLDCTSERCRLSCLVTTGLQNSNVPQSRAKCQDASKNQLVSKDQLGKDVEGCKPGKP